MKYEDEITVTVNMSKDELIKFLNDDGYNKIDDYFVDDVYLIQNGVSLSDNVLNLLDKCILVRNIDNHKTFLTYKYKEYEKDGSILKQTKTNCKIDNIQEGINFIKCLDYYEFIKIYDHIVVYEKDKFEICIQEVNNKYLLIEVEANSKYPTIESLINKLNSIGIDYDKSNYFVKKAELVFYDTYQK